MKNLYIYLSACSFLLFTFQPVKSQVAIGNEPNIEKGVVFKVRSADKGILFPRVALQAKNMYQPLTEEPPTGTLVFNTTTTSTEDLHKGLYWWNHETYSWVSFAFVTKNYAIKYANTDNTTNLATGVNGGDPIPIFGKVQFPDDTSGFTKISDTQLKFNHSGFYAITVNLDLYTVTTSRGECIMVQMYTNGARTPQTTSQLVYSTFSKHNFFTSFSEYLNIKEGDVIELRSTKLTSYGSNIKLNPDRANSSSITISRITDTINPIN